MTTLAAEDIIAAVRARGGILYLVNGRRIAVTPSAALDAELRAAIQASTAEIVRALRAEQAEAPAVGFDYFASPYADLFRDLCGAAGGAPGDLAAVAWAEANGWPGIVDTLRAIDHRCEVLAAADDEAGFRATVRELVELFATIRGAYRTRPVKVAP